MSASWRADSARLTFIAALSIALLWLNPFDLGRWTEYAKEDLFFRLAAFEYPDRAPPIELVIADDTALRAAESQDGRSNALPASWNRWPLPLYAWADAIAVAADRGAKAIFLDIVIIDERDPAEVSALADAITYASETADVFIAAGGAEYGANDIYLAEIQALERDNVRVHFVSASRSDDESLSDSYRLAPRGDLPSAASAIALTLCGEQPNCTALGERLSTIDSFPLWWKAPPPASNCEATPEDLAYITGCKGMAQSALGRGGQLLWLGMTQGICDNFDASGQSGFCGARSRYSFRNTPHRRATLQDYLAPSQEDREPAEIVIIGADFAFARDSARSPVYGDIPGVAMHAMALDNVLALDGRPFQRLENLGVNPTLFRSVWILGFCLIAWLMHVVLRRFVPNLSERAGLADSALLFVCVAATVAVEFALRIAPADWFSVMGAVALSAGAYWSGKRLA